MKNSIAVDIQNLTTGHGARLLARNISVKLLHGELTALLGVNGVGKSTLLRIIALFQNPIGGNIVLGGRDLTDYDQTALSKELSIVMTQRPPISNLTVHDVVAMGRSPYTGFWGRLTAYDERIVDEAMQAVKIDGLKERMVQTLSDGEFQKVMIAKAIAQQTSVLLLDEPTAFLDFPSKIKLMQMLRELARSRDMAILLSSHDVELALHFADKLWILSEDGSIAAGNPKEMSEEGRLDKFFESEGIEFDKEKMVFNVKTDNKE